MNDPLSPERSGNVSPSRDPEQQRILAALDGAIPRVRRPTLYHIGQLAVAIVMVALPLLYLSLTVGLGYLLYLHASQRVTILGGRVGYLAPLVVGLIMLFFLLKPIFAPRPKRVDPVVLDRTGQSFLFAFVDRLADLVGAPKPRQIAVNCDVNAAASFRRGFASFLGSDLTLTIGLPLVSGLSLRELTGVLSHELGHFAQGGGMRLSYVIRSVNAWFAHVVYERDAWDERLARATERGGILWIWLLLVVSRIGVWISRRILWVLMVVGHVVSAFLMRQMEYDADRYTARISGGRTVADIAPRMQVLGVGAQLTYQRLEEAWQSRRLVDDLPAWIVVNAEEIPEEVKTAIAQDALAAKVGLLGTHPSDGDRIRNVEREATDGIFHLEEPADVLLDDGAGLRREATLHHYRAFAGLEVDETNLVGIDTLVTEGQEDARHAEAAGRYVVAPVSELVPFFPRSHDLPQISSCEEARLDLEALRQTGVATGSVQIEHEKLADIEGEIIGAKLIRCLTRAKVKIDRARFGIPEPPADSEGAGSLSSAKKRREKALSVIEPLHVALDLRLRTALAAIPDLEPAFDPPAGWEGGSVARAVKLLDTLGRLRAVSSHVDDLRRDFLVFVQLAQHVSEYEHKDRYLAEFRRAGDEIVSDLASLLRGLGNAPYPFDHAQADATLGTTCVVEVMDVDDPGAVGAAAEQTLDRLHLVYVRAMGELCEAAERSERALGLEPIEPVEVSETPA